MESFSSIMIPDLSNFPDVNRGEIFRVIGNSPTGSSLLFTLLSLTIPEISNDEPTDEPTEVSEPTTLVLFGIGLAGLGVMRRRRTVNQGSRPWPFK